MLRISFIFLLLLPFVLKGQETSIDSLARYHAATAINSGKIQQELIYLHLDNNSYYRGDRIFFACYLVTSGKLEPSTLSRTVYVELLNPNGKIIDRCVLKAEDGRCHGSLIADETPFYSGYYEIRAYTKYMLNFGPEAMFSRVIPIYDAPKVPGTWAERKIHNTNSKTVPNLRPKRKGVSRIDMKFYPEGGHLVQDLPARVAFELSDANHRPLADIAGRIIDRSNDSVVATFRSGYMGRGAVDFIPQASRYSAEVSVNGKRYWCNLPEVESSGVSLRVDNLQSPDSIEISVGRTSNCQTKVIGLSLTCRGELYGRTIIDLSDEPMASFKLPTDKLPSGVAMITLFSSEGKPIADRLIFNNRNDFAEVKYSFNKSRYSPYETVDLDVRIADRNSGSPISTPFSISVCDSDNHIFYGSNILAELLLASEIKGYVHNPAYYFEEGKEAELDQLLMVQGWRKYSWSELAGMVPIRIESMPEQGIEISGQVLERYRNRPKTNIAVSAMLSPVDSTNIFGSKAKAFTFVTDSCGRFNLSDNIEGDYMMLLSSANKNKVSNNRILLDVSNIPESKAYDVGETNVEILEEKHSVIPTDRDTTAYEPIVPDTKLLKEVEVTAQYTPAWWTAHYKENSIVSYDVLKEANSLKDSGEKYLRTLADLLPQMDKNFKRDKYDSLTYSGKRVLLVADPDFGDNGDVIDELMGVLEIVHTAAGIAIIPTSDPGAIPIDFIKNVYINTQQETLMTYAARMTEKLHTSRFDEMMDAYKKYGCVVFIEFYPDKRSELKSGVRRDLISGYTVPAVEFYSPDYSAEVPLEPDYRRTLYWNPEAMTNEDGTANIKFSNNSTARNFIVTVATLKQLCE